MATCAMLGQAVGFAAAVAVRRGVSARDAGAYIGEIQGLMRLHDCYLLHTDINQKPDHKSATSDRVFEVKNEKN